MELQKEEKLRRMTTEDVRSLVNRLAVPTVISSLVTSFYNLADTVYVRQLSLDSMVAAVGVAMPLMTAIQAIGFYHGHGSGNYISRAFGRRDFVRAEKMAATGFAYALFFGLLLALLGLSFPTALAVLLGAKTEQTLQYSVEYMRYILLAAPFMTGALVMNNQLRLQGNAFFSMLGLASGAVTNLVLDPLLIYSAGDALLDGAVVMPFGAGMGVAGAALATAISQLLSFLVLIIGMERSDNIKIRWKNISLDRFYLKNIVKGGLPSLARQSMASLATAALNHSVGLYLDGDALIEAMQAAMTGVSRLMFFLFSAVLGFGQGFQPVCGMNYGAKRYDRVLEAFRYCLRVGTAVLLVISALGLVFARPVTAIVAGASAEAAEIACFSFRAQLAVFPLVIWVALGSMMMQNIGVTGKATVSALARQGLTYVPCVLLLPMLCPSALLGLELAQPVADVLAFAIVCPLTVGELKRMKQQAETENEKR